VNLWTISRVLPERVPKRDPFPSLESAGRNEHSHDNEAPFRVVLEEFFERFDVEPTVTHVQGAEVSGVMGGLTC
jgi:hypothetical protein